MSTKVKDFGYFFDLAKFMQEREFSASKLADQAKISPQALNKILAGTKPVSAYTIAKVVQALNGFTYEPDKRIEFETVFTQSSDIEKSSATSKALPEISGVSPLEFAALALTNAYTWNNGYDEFHFRLLTSKQAYFYLPFISRMLDPASTEAAFNIEIERFESRLLESFQSSFSDVVPSIPTSYLSSQEVQGALILLDWSAEEAELVNKSLRKLYDRGLIIDPILETVGTVAVATLGIVPTSFTKRTVEGDIVYRKVSALLWEFEMQKEEEKETRRLHFRVEKIITTFKQVIASLNAHFNP